MRRFIRKITLVLMVFLTPALASVAVWAAQDRPGSWRRADWSSAGVLPPARESPAAAVYVMAARTGGMKGALAVHTWIVTKAAGAGQYDRYDKVGWGLPVRHNNYPADGRWYSNTPAVVTSVHGGEAARIIPKIEAAIASYPYDFRGGYRLWPGPNSNSFTAHVLRQVPELNTVLPPEAVGRDFAEGSGMIQIAPDWLDVHVNLFGLAGFAFGTRSGLELQFLGLVLGIDVANPALKLPGFGRVAFWSQSS